MGRHKKIVETVLRKDEEIPIVSSPSKLSGKGIMNFSGEDYNASLRLASEWRDRVNKDKNSLMKDVVLVDYYPQIMAKKSILVSYSYSLKEV